MNLLGFSTRKALVIGICIKKCCHLWIPFKHYILSFIEVGAIRAAFCEDPNLEWWVWRPFLYSLTGNEAAIHRSERIWRSMMPRNFPPRAMLIIAASRRILRKVTEILWFFIKYLEKAGISEEFFLVKLLSVSYYNLWYYLRFPWLS